MKQKLIHIDLDVEVDDTQYHGSALAKDGGESLGVPAGSISAVQAQQNYPLLYWQDKQQSKDYLLRQQISDLERQLESANIVRCHRSWLVNWQKVQGVTGNAQGYQLALENSPNHVPLSRGYAKKVLPLIASLNKALQGQ